MILPAYPGRRSDDGTEPLLLGKNSQKRDAILWGGHGKNTRFGQEKNSRKKREKGVDKRLWEVLYYSSTSGIPDGFHPEKQCFSNSTEFEKVVDKMESLC